MLCKLVDNVSRDESLAKSSGRDSFRLSVRCRLNPGDAGKPLAGGIDLAQLRV